MSDSEMPGGLTTRPLLDEDIAWADGLIGAAFGGRRQLRSYQRRGFRVADVRPGALDDARRSLKPTIPEVGRFGIPIRDEIILERRVR